MSTEDNIPARRVVVDAEVLRTVVREAVADAMGVEPNDLKALRKDLVYLREWRQTMETIRTESITAAVKWVVTGILVLIAIGLGIKMGLHFPD